MVSSVDPVPLDEDISEADREEVEEEVQQVCDDSTRVLDNDDNSDNFVQEIFGGEEKITAVNIWPPPLPPQLVIPKLATPPPPPPRTVRSSRDTSPIDLSSGGTTSHSAIAARKQNPLNGRVLFVCRF